MRVDGEMGAGIKQSGDVFITSASEKDKSVFEKIVVKNSKHLKTLMTLENVEEN